MILNLLARINASTPNAKIFRAGLVVSALGAAVALTTAAKDLVIARYFGRSDAIDAFFIAYLLPSFVIGLLTGSLGSAIIPVFVHVKKIKGPEAAQALFSDIALLDLLTLLFMAMLIGLLAPFYLPYLGSGFTPEKLAVTRRLLLTLLPFVVFNGLSMYMIAVLNAAERFALPAAIPLITPTAVMLSMVLAVTTWGAYAIVVGTVSGSLIELTALAFALKRHGLRFAVKWHGWTEDVRSVLRQYSPTLAGSLLIGSALVVDKAMAAMLPPGSVAALSYANKIVTGVCLIAATGLGNAAFPYFSQMVSAQDWAGCRHTLKRYSCLVMAVAVPLTVGLMAVSKPIVKLLFQRGAFSAADTELVSKVQVCYLIQIPFFILGMLLVKFLSAARRNDLLMYGAAISLALDIALNLMLMRYWGVAGIALSTSAVYVCSLIYLVNCSARILRSDRPLATVPEIESAVF